MKQKKTVSKRYTVLIAVIAITALIFSTVAGTLAWLEAKSDTLVNTFEPGDVPIEINEEKDDGVKSNVTITNTGNIPAYIRVAVIPVWREADIDGNSTGENTGLKAISDYDITKGYESGLANYTISFNENDWFRGSDGYWYYKSPLSSDEKDGENISKVLIYSCEPNTFKEDSPYYGKVFELQIIASSIQAEPDDAVESAWTNVKVVNGKLEKVNP